MTTEDFDRLIAPLRKRLVTEADAPPPTMPDADDAFLDAIVAIAKGVDDRSIARDNAIEARLAYLEQRASRAPE